MILLMGLLSAAAPSVDAPPVGFKADVAPILVRRCLACHDAEDPQGGLEMTTFARLRAGGHIEGEAILEPGDPDASHLVAVVRPDAPIRMPHEQEPLSDAEIETIERWVAQGAKFDGPSEAETLLASLVDPLANLAPIAPKAPVADPISSVAFTPDGSRLAAARGGEVFVFDQGANTPSIHLTDHPGPVTFAAFSPDAARLVVAGGKSGLFGFVAAWDLATKARLAETRGHDDAILGAALSPDGSTLATCSYDRLIKLWDVATLTERATLKEHTDAVYAVAFAPDGARLASAGGDRAAKVWDVATGRRLVSLGDSTAELFTVAFGPDGNDLFAAGADKTIWAWRLGGETGRLARSAIAHDAAVLRLAVTPDGSRLYSTGEDRAIKAWTLPDLKPLAAFERQPDWPQAIAVRPDGSELAIGRYDGSLVLASIEAAEASILLTAPRAEPPAPAPKPELVRAATLGAPSPRGAIRGARPTLTLAGKSVGLADQLVFDDPAITASLSEADPAKPDERRADLTIGETARVGPHRFWAHTPDGTPAAQLFLVVEAEEAAEQEPNEAPDSATPSPLPRTLAGSIDKPGDVDCWRLDVEPGRDLVLLDRGKAIGSALDPLYELLDPAGAVVASGRGTLAHRPDAPGPLTLRITDQQYGGSGNHLYRIEAGYRPIVEDVFPRGAAIGAATDLEIRGRNLAPGPYSAHPGPAVPPGTIFPAIVMGADGRSLADDLKLVAAEGPQGHEAEPNDEPRAGDGGASIPFGVSGRIDRPDDIDVFRFEARAGQPIIVEVFARRLTSPLDPVLEITDGAGVPIPRAVLRPVAETAVAFRDHNSTQDAIRLTKWDELRMDDYLLIGRELMRIKALPRNPDDDARFWSVGGARLGYLGTTPEQHTLAQPIYRVEIHPPGATFPPGGPAPVTIPYRNDDGGPGPGKDSYLRFDPPADGTYFARVRDARNEGGEGFSYHLVARPPRPDFALSASTENPNVPRGSTALVTASIRRLDGFDAPVDVAIEGLPPGITATPARIEPGHFTAELGLTAAPDAPALSPPTWRLIATSITDDASEPATQIRHELDPAGPAAGWITATPAPDLNVTASADRLEIVPGREATLTFRIERSPAFEGRVPIEVKNLPHGVRVLDIGLNGVLITEEQTERRVTIYAEPWVQPTERPFYAVAKVEATGAESSTGPILLVVISTNSSASTANEWPE